MEKSIFWQTNGRGDGKAEGYGASDLFEIHRMLWTNDPDTQGVSKGYLNELEATNPAGTTVTIDTGGALVYGIPYINTSPVSFVVPVPVINTTGWRIVLRADWEEQTVRLVLLMNADGNPAVPTRTTVAGVRWEITVALGTVTILGVLSLLSSPDYLDPGIEIDDSKIETVSRRVLVPATECQTGGAHVVQTSDLGWPMANGVSTYCYGRWRVPLDLVSGNFLVDALYIPSATSGNTIDTTHTEYLGEAWQVYNTHTVTRNDITPAGTINQISVIQQNSLSLVVSEDDYVFFNFLRNGAAGTDTFAGTIYFVGWRIQYRTSS